MADHDDQDLNETSGDLPEPDDVTEPEPYEENNHPVNGPEDPHANGIQYDIRYSEQYLIAANMAGFNIHHLARILYPNYGDPVLVDTEDGGKDMLGPNGARLPLAHFVLDHYCTHVYCELPPPVFWERFSPEFDYTSLYFDGADWLDLGREESDNSWRWLIHYKSGKAETGTFPSLKPTVDFETACSLFGRFCSHTMDDVDNATLLQPGDQRIT